MILFVILVFTDVILSCNVWKAYDLRKEKRIGKSRSLTKLHHATPHISLLQEMMTFVVLGLTAQQVLLKERGTFYFLKINKFNDQVLLSG